MLYIKKCCKRSQNSLFGKIMNGIQLYNIIFGITLTFILGHILIYSLALNQYMLGNIFSVNFIKTTQKFTCESAYSPLE